MEHRQCCGSTGAVLFHPVAPFFPLCRFNRVSALQCLVVSLILPQIGFLLCLTLSQASSSLHRCFFWCELTPSSSSNGRSALISVTADHVGSSVVDIPRWVFCSVGHLRFASWCKGCCCCFF